MGGNDLQRIEHLLQRVDTLQTEMESRERLEESLRANEARYRQLFEANPLPMWVYDRETLAFLAVNDAAVDHYGYSRDDFLAMTIADIRPRSDVPALRDRVNGATAGIEHAGIWQHRKRDGSVILVEITSHVIEFSGRNAKLVLANDVTQRIEQDHKIRRLNRIHAVTGAISSAMMRLRNRSELLQEACRIATTEGIFPFAWIGAINPQTQKPEILAWHGDAQTFDLIRAMVGRDLWPEAHRPSVRAMRTQRAVVINDLAIDTTVAPIRDDVLRAGFRSVAAFPLFIESTAVAALVLLAAEADFFDAEEVTLLCRLTTDLSNGLQYVEQLQRLQYLASYDALTGLPNARLFGDQLQQSIQVARQEGNAVCLAVIDLERFTLINDTWGREAGDELLRQVAQRFRDALVEPCSLGRIAADTFAVASPNKVIATTLCDHLLDALKTPFRIGDHTIRVTAQAGIALFPTDGEDGRTIFKNAESALKLAKSSGQRSLYYASEMNAQMAQRRQLEEQLRTAIELQQFVLHYQPRVDMVSGELVAAEALIRWQHPEQGLIFPGKFIPLAEETGLIVAMGTWAIQTVCSQQAAWLAARLNIVPISVNLSTVQFESGNLLNVVRDALAASRLDAKYLELELTESAVMRDADAAADALTKLRELGVGLALDDFGTGYSSLALVKRFPFRAIKIDKSFVADITHDAGDAVIATAIIAMAHRLNLRVVAEGVETQGQFNYLRAQGCDEMQGNFFSPAITSTAFESQLRTHQRLTLPEQSPADQRTLLIVDDEPGIRAALSRMLRNDGYRILTAGSGAEGLELLAVNPVQVIISDQRMPGMSGTEFLGTVKQLYPDTVRIILSGYTDLRAVTDSINHGAVFKFLTKPWDDDLLREQIRDAFRHYR